jgi:hypothetical protein
MGFHPNQRASGTAREPNHSFGFVIIGEPKWRVRTYCPPEWIRTKGRPTF